MPLMGTLLSLPQTCSNGRWHRSHQPTWVVTILQGFSLQAVPFQSDPNGIKLGSNSLLFQCLTCFTPWLCEERIWFGPAFDGTRLHAARTVGIDDQGGQRFPRTRRAEPPQGINEADPLQGHALPLRRGQHHHADEVVDEREDGQLLQDPDEAFAVQHIKAHRLFEVPEIALDLPPRPV